MRQLTRGIVLALCLGFMGTGCLVHVRGTRRAGSSCGAGKVWVKRGHEWKCKKAHHDNGRHEGRERGRGHGHGRGGVEKRDHRH